MVKKEAENLPVLVLVHPFSLFGESKVTIILGSLMTRNGDGVMLNGGSASLDGWSRAWLIELLLE
jgi:hypothetical protein